MRVALINVTVAFGALLATRAITLATPDVPLLATPAWQAKAPAYGEQLLLRRDTQAPRMLLLKHSAHEGAYRYDPQTLSLTAIADQDWNRAGGAITECATQSPPSPQALRIDPQSHRLMAGSREVLTAGRTVLAVTASPSRRYAAVLSAEGPAAGSLVPFLGSGGATGQRLHQLVSLPGAAVIGNTIPIPVRRSEDVLAACWSSDERVIVYYDVLFAHMSVIDVDF